VNPDLYEKHRRMLINHEKFLRAEGLLQNQDHTIFIKAFRVLWMSINAAAQSHDFHSSVSPAAATRRYFFNSFESRS
jgi:hypothetical protein